MAAEQVGNCRRGATKVDGYDLDVGLAHQQFPGEVRDRTGSRGREVEFARIGTRVGEKLLEGLDAERRVTTRTAGTVPMPVTGVRSFRASNAGGVLRYGGTRTEA